MSKKGKKAPILAPKKPLGLDKIASKIHAHQRTLESLESVLLGFAQPMRSSFPPPQNAWEEKIFLQLMATFWNFAVLDEMTTASGKRTEYEDLVITLKEQIVVEIGVSPQAANDLFVEFKRIRQQLYPHDYRLIGEVQVQDLGEVRRTRVLEMERPQATV